MEFRIADTFTSSLTKLDAQAQKQVKTTAFDLQLNPAHPGLQFHRLTKSKDPNFWSVRAGQDIRVIVHKTDASLLLCFADHHDAAYAWAERRRIERHPKTGAAQLVSIPEVEQPESNGMPSSPASAPTAAKTHKAALFQHLTDDELLSYGVPQDWLATVRQVDEDRLFDLAKDLPQEAMEALLDLATGTTPNKATVTTPDSDPFAHPDAQRRFRLLEDVEALTLALDYPWDKWTVFLHPAQRQLVQRQFKGPARVTGSAGTGKTIVALHRAAALARRYPSSRVLLTTFSDALANALAIRLDRLIGADSDVRARIQVQALDAFGQTLYTERFGPPRLATESEIRAWLSSANGSNNFPANFLFSEWTTVVDAWQIRTWESYRDVPRLGRKTRIGGKQREPLWAVFEQVLKALADAGKTTRSALFAQLTDALRETKSCPINFAVIDEAQDIGIAELRFLAAATTAHPEALYFAGDLGQRIFQQPFSWKALGVDIRGRSQTLRINYRTSHQIRTQADKLLPDSIADVDGEKDSRRGTQSLFNGPEPVRQIFDAPEEEAQGVGKWIATRLADGLQPQEIAVFVRDESLIPRAHQAIQHAEAKPADLTTKMRITPDAIAVGTMHLAKGLEFRAVAVMACDDEALPLQSRIESITDDADLEEVYNTERHLLYVACTRARDWLLVTGVDPASEFLDDMH